MICKLLCLHAGQLLVATLRWDPFDWKRGIVQIEQEKGGKALVLPIRPMLWGALKPLPRTGDTVPVTAYDKPFSAKSQAGTMAHWTFKAGLPKGCTLGSPWVSCSQRAVRVHGSAWTYSP